MVKAHIPNDYVQHRQILLLTATVVTCHLLSLCNTFAKSLNVTVSYLYICRVMGPGRGGVGAVEMSHLYQSGTHRFRANQI
jgi:hypothetical protein